MIELLTILKYLLSPSEVCENVLKNTALQKQKDVIFRPLLPSLWRYNLSSQDDASSYLVSWFLSRFSSFSCKSWKHIGPIIQHLLYDIFSSQISKEHLTLLKMLMAILLLCSGEKMYSYLLFGAPLAMVGWKVGQLSFSEAIHFFDMVYLKNDHQSFFHNRMAKSQENRSTFGYSFGYLFSAGTLESSYP
jgi:hypothetical protein